MTCRRCQCAMVGRPCKGLRRPPAGARVHDGRGLCSACVSALRKRDPEALLDYPATHVRREDVVDGYQRLRQRDENLTLAQIAEQLGMTRAALERALTRARRAGDLPQQARVPSHRAGEYRRHRAAKAAERAA